MSQEYDEQLGVPNRSFFEEVKRRAGKLEWYLMLALAVVFAGIIMAVLPYFLGSFLTVDVKNLVEIIGILLAGIPVLLFPLHMAIQPPNKFGEKWRALAWGYKSMAIMAITIGVLAMLAAYISPVFNLGFTVAQNRFLLITGASLTGLTCLIHALHIHTQPSHTLGKIWRKYHLGWKTLLITISALLIVTAIYLPQVEWFKDFFAAPAFWDLTKGNVFIVAAALVILGVFVRHVASEYESEDPNAYQSINHGNESIGLESLPALGLDNPYQAGPAPPMVATPSDVQDVPRAAPLRVVGNSPPKTNNAGVLDDTQALLPAGFSASEYGAIG